MPTSVHKSKQRLDSRRTNGCKTPSAGTSKYIQTTKKDGVVEAAEMFLSGTPLKSVYRVISRDGRVVWFQCEASMLRRRDGRPWAIQGVGFDITNLKESEQSLYDKNAQLELLKDIATTANQATTIAQAMQFAVDRVCEFTAWPLGHAFARTASGFLPHLELNPRATIRCIPFGF